MYIMTSNSRLQCNSAEIFHVLGKKCKLKPKIKQQLHPMYHFMLSMK